MVYINVFCPKAVGSRVFRDGDSRRIITVDGSRGETHFIGSISVPGNLPSCDGKCYILGFRGGYTDTGLLLGEPCNEGVLKVDAISGPGLPCIQAVSIGGIGIAGEPDEPGEPGEPYS